jgi:hypothetical protein
MNPVLIAWPLGPVTSTEAIPSGSGLESIWLTGILNVPSAPVTGLTGAVMSTTGLFDGSISVSLTVRD